MSIKLVMAVIVVLLLVANSELLTLSMITLGLGKVAFKLLGIAGELDE